MSAESPADVYKQSHQQVYPYFLSVGNFAVFIVANPTHNNVSSAACKRRRILNNYVVTWTGVVTGKARRSWIACGLNEKEDRQVAMKHVLRWDKLSHAEGR